MAELPKCKAEALATGVRVFHPGTRCTRCGHFAPRRLRGGRRGSECVRCLKLREAEYRIGGLPRTRL